jgi:hypothetical protein
MICSRVLSLLPGDIPLVCGGKQDGTNSPRCYKYDIDSDDWQYTGSMPLTMAYSGSIFTKTNKKKIGVPFLADLIEMSLEELRYISTIKRHFKFNDKNGFF